MWKSISQVLADQFGAYYNIKEKNKVPGGEVNETWLSYGWNPTGLC